VDMYVYILNCDGFMRAINAWRSGIYLAW
jgi:hypothetical protein